MAIAKGATVGAALFLGVFLFRLGFFLLILLPLGALVSLVVTLKEQRASRWRGVVVMAALLAYAGATSLLFWALTNQVSRQAFEMSWREGADNRRGESEVVLEFAQFPGNEIGIYSNALREHLVRSGSNRTDVEFEVVSDLWCHRLSHEIRIGDLTDLSTLKRVGGYFRRAGDQRSPWGRDPFWCRW